MKYIILILAMLGFPLLTISTAENYSCRDNNNRLHIADNLMSLPEECRDQADISAPNGSGKVSYVPPAVQTRQSNNDFERALREEERKTRQRKTEAENLILEAENLANTYGNAGIKRKTALRSKKYGSRETIILAGQEMQRARNGKEILLEKLERARLSSTQRAQITTLLNKIQN